MTLGLEGDEAIDYIDKMIKECDGWIFIDNENPVMPEVQQKVIVFTDYGIVTEMTYRSNVYAATEKGKIPRFEWHGKISPWLVIAWMPLPSPPAK